MDIGGRCSKEIMKLNVKNKGLTPFGSFNYSIVND